MPKTLAAPILALILTAACVPPAASDGIAGEWHLVGLEFQPAPAPLSITFGTDGKVTGKAPCNQFFGSYTAALPAFSLGAIGATKMACPDLAAETAYFEALAAMQKAELSDNRLFLTGPEGRLLEFTRDLAAEGTCLSCLAAQ